ncbi:hypothetical protein D3C71_1611140 [compost metagenome]
MRYEIHVSKRGSIGFELLRFDCALLIYWPDTYNNELLNERRALSDEMRAWMVEQFDPDGDWAFDDKSVNTTRVYFMDAKDMMLFKLRWA